MAKTSHKTYLKAFEKASLDINAMVGLKQCVKLYCNDSKTFLSNDIVPENYKLYLDELVNSIERGIGIGLSNRITFFSEEINKVEETKDFYLYLLMKEGLALTYSIAELKKVAILMYDEIISPPEIYLPINYGIITEDELIRTSDISMSEFRCSNKTMSPLYLRKYIFSCQKKLLEAENDYIAISHLSLNFVCTCLGLFKNFSEKEEKNLGST